MYKYNNDTIAGIASGIGGAIGIIRISGEDSLKIAGKIFRKRNFIKKDSNCNMSEWDESFFCNASSHTIHYGYIVDSDIIIDEVILLLMKGPNSYTKEDIIEIDTHGGTYVIDQIMKLLVKNGVRIAQPGEFTKRAFLNGRIDLSQAESVMDIIASKNEYAHSSSISQLQGKLSNYIKDIRDNILYDLSFVEAGLDDPEHIDIDGYTDKILEHTNNNIDKLKSLLNSYQDGRIYTQGINTVIVGRPNAGKSSILNLFLDSERAIVTNVAGTTRDILEETVKIGNILLNLVDTAGIHETDDLVENIGVSRSISYIQKADFIIYVVDISDKFNDDDDKIIEEIKDKKGIILYNKSDLKFDRDKTYETKLKWKCIDFSVETKDGFDLLKDYINEEFYSGSIGFNDQVHITGSRHFEAVSNALESLNKLILTINDGMPEDLYCIDMMDAYDSLGIISGDTASDDMINNIFKNFCMGK